MTKAFFKIIKYGILVAILIFIKNIYSSYNHLDHHAHIVTVKMPDIIELTEIENEYINRESYDN